MKISDIESAQKTWVNAVCNRNIEELMSLYSDDSILKPTLSNTIRNTKEDIRLYFKGGKKFNDIGFLNTGICKVEFIERSDFAILFICKER